MKKKEARREKANIISEDEVKIVVVSNNIMGSWKKLHPITKQVCYHGNHFPCIINCFFSVHFMADLKTDDFSSLPLFRRLLADKGRYLLLSSYLYLKHRTFPPNRYSR